MSAGGSLFVWGNQDVAWRWTTKPRLVKEILKKAQLRASGRLAHPFMRPHSGAAKRGRHGDWRTCIDSVRTGRISSVVMRIACNHLAAQGRQPAIVRSSALSAYMLRYGVFISGLAAPGPLGACLT